MNKLILLLMLLPLISATVVYSGETTTLNVSEDYAYYSIIGNSTPINLKVVQEGNQVFITPDKYSSNDSFELVFFNQEKEIITQVVHSGGGGGSTTKYVDRNVTEYYPIEKIVEKVVNNTSEPEIIETNKIPSWVWVLVGALVLGIIFILYMGFRNTDLDTDERGLEGPHE